MADDLNDIRYIPRNVSEARDVKDLASRLQQELERLQRVIDVLVEGYDPITYVEPERPRDGMRRFADGTNWDPGSATGVYSYHSGTWNKLG
jgi:hypothetical protein